MKNFEKRRGSTSGLTGTGPIDLGTYLDNAQQERLAKIRRNWNFYEGFHWEDVPTTDSPEVTFNYCRAFVDKFVAFELGKAFTISVHKSMTEHKVTSDSRTLFEYLEDVWEDNNQYLFAVEMGQMKSITGEAWVRVSYSDPDEVAPLDPFNEYPDGRLVLSLMPTNVVFPQYNPHQQGVLTSVAIVYAYEREVYPNIFSVKPTKETAVFKQVWTPETVTTQDGNGEPVELPNKYGVIPFVQIKNFPVAGKNDGRSDLEDINPLNTEFNFKKSNFSEILDYHAAPVTIVYGAKVGNLEKGANKLWGGLAKDARVENLELSSDLPASRDYLKELQTAMCEIGGIPQTVLGGTQSISNTSGVALQYMNLPLIEKTRVKRACTENGLEALNKLILLVSMLEGLITKPEEVSARDFFRTEVDIPDTLPKDALLELQQIETEMRLGLVSRPLALKRMGREDIPGILSAVEEDAEKNPQFYSIAPKVPGEDGEIPKINSGMLNGQTPLEQLRIEMEGKNG